MSTRAAYTFIGHGRYHVYVHHDGYPEGAAKYFKEVLASGKVWPLPRFEADEFAAGFVATLKTRDGDVRLMTSADDAGDVEFKYTVFIEPTNQDLGLIVYKVDNEHGDEMLWKGSMQEFLQMDGCID